jgi:hypothetical protein
MSIKKFDGKHLTTTQRIKIEKGLMDGKSFALIARNIEKHPSTVAKEVKKYRYFPRRENNQEELQCSFYKSCQMRFLCDDKDCIRPCKLCYDTILRKRKCTSICPDYQEKVCPRIQKAPYVCNGCLKFRRCNLQHALYSAQQQTNLPTNS